MNDSYKIYASKDYVDEQIEILNEEMATKVPSGAAAHQMLVTDAEGNSKWEEQLAYVSGETETVLLSEEENTADDEGYLFGFESELVEGRTYIVTMNGTKYECVAYLATDGEGEDAYSFTAFGNANLYPWGSLSDDVLSHSKNEPFMGICSGGYTELYIGVDAADTKATVAVSTIVPTYKTIQDEMLPGNLARVYYIADGEKITLEQAQTISYAMRSAKCIGVMWGSDLYTYFNASSTEVFVTPVNRQGYFKLKPDENGYYHHTNKSWPVELQYTGDEHEFSRGMFTPESGKSVFVRFQGSSSKEVTIMGDGTINAHSYTLPSSTEGSTKRFKISVDDTGAITATEVTE